jgi:hypothetical protein
MRTETQTYFEFYCTQLIHKQDGVIIMSECKHMTEEGYWKFKQNVELWNRTGNWMKDALSPSVTPIKGYDYYITEEQDAKNKMAPMKRREVISWERFNATVRDFHEMQR